MPKKQQKEPFLHIQQTGIKPPVGHMQEIFISRIAEKEKKELAKEHLEQHDDKSVAEEKKATQADRKNEQELIIKNQENEEKELEDRKTNPSSFSANQERKPRSSFQRLKGFKEMTIMERVNYLVDFPKQIPPVSCIFETEEKTVRGIFVGKTDDSIDIRKHDGKITTIPIESLKDVKMIGLR